MNNIGKSSFDIGYLDTLSGQDTLLHRLDPRAKLITTIAFIICVVSFDKYTLSALVPFFIYPVVLISAGGLPAKYIFKKAILVSPFAILVGLFNPFIDRQVLFYAGSIGISGGWVSLFSIALRFILTVSAALVLVSLTGFNAICAGLEKFRVPKPLVVQLLFFYRYIFVLVDEADRMVRAWSSRAFNSAEIHLKTYAFLTGSLLLRAFDRAERIYRAMCCRGFDGDVRIVRPMRIGCREIIFISGWIIAFVLMRYFNFALGLGALFGRLIR